jgi:aldoxime dehydratase
MPAKRMPENWTPPYPVWVPEFDGVSDSIVIAYFGEQLPPDEHTGALGGAMAAALTEDSAPDTVERARFVDKSGRPNDVFLAYWTSESRYRAWWETSSFRLWWDAAERERGSSGFWREVHVQPVRRLESNTSSIDPAATQKGVTLAAPALRGPIPEIGYWGAARDRIPDSEVDDFGATRSWTEPAGSVADSLGRRVRPAFSDNMVMIRSGQDWTRSGANELRTYRTLVEPVLNQGMAYLIDHPADSGCISCRPMRQVDTTTGAPLGQTFTTAYFLSLHHLEQWAWHHPTHEAIYAKAQEMIRTCNYQLDLHLWHEVLILHHNTSEAEYVNCAGPVGLMRLGEAQALPA